MIYHHAAACCISTAKPTLSMQTTTDLIRGLAIVESVYYQSQFQHLINFAHRGHVEIVDIERTRLPRDTTNLIEPDQRVLLKRRVRCFENILNEYCRSQL